MLFHEVRLPEDISFGASGGPSFSTDIITMKNGNEQRNINWSRPRMRYNLVNTIKNQGSFDLINAFFYNRKGRAYGFRYKDWADYQAIGQVVGVADGVETQFQLIKTYDSGSNQLSRTISKPVENTVSVYMDAVLQSSGYSIDITTGILTFSSAPSNGAIISVDFEFDVPVRFDSDNLEVRVDSVNSFSVNDILLIEVQP